MTPERNPRAVAHDLANVLGAIESSTELLLSSLDAPHLRLLAEDIRASARVAAAISRQLTDHEVPAPAAPAEIDDAIDQARGLLRRLAGDRVALEIDLGCPRRAIPLDGASLLRALVNLVVNARDAMPSGGVVRIATAASGDAEGTPCAVLTVADSGSGIAAEVRARLFEPRVSSKGPGRGQGLATVRELVRSARGSIAVESAPGRGATFRLCWPAVPARPPGHAAAMTPPIPEHLSLLLVDDDDLGRNVLRDLFRAAGIDVIAVDDGRGAIAAFDAAEPPPAVAVIDLHLAREPGCEVGGALRRQCPRLPLIYISGLDDLDPEVRDAMRSGGATRFVGKPFAFQRLLDEIRTLVAG